MTVTSFAVRKRSGGSSAARKGVLAEYINRRYVKEYIVKTNDAADGPNVILKSFGFPKIGEQYALFNDSDALATCTNVELDPTDDTMTWIATVTYDTDRLVSLATDNPLNIPAEVSWTFTPYELPIYRDGLGVPIVNSAGHYFADPTMIDWVRPTLHVKRNELAYSPALSLLYHNAVNSDEFAGAAARCAKLTRYTGNRRIDSGVIYQEIDYEVEFDPRTFDHFILDKGFKDANGRLFRDPIDFAPLSNETLLNGRGQNITTAVTTLMIDIDANEQLLTAADASNFPPLSPSPPHWYFEVKIDSEILQVLSAPAVGQWRVIRGYGGTTPAAHYAGRSITLQPYYLRFLPTKVLPFAPLRIPTA